MAALASAPAGAQTVTIAASGNCGGTPANCGTASNRNGDRDTTWPGLQVDEGDELTFTVSLDRLTNPTDIVVSSVAFSGSAYTSSDLSVSSGFGSTITSPIGTTVGGISLSRARTLNVTSDGAAEGDETVSATLNVLTAGYTIGNPSSVTVIIRGTDSAPSFGTGSVSAKTFTITATDADSNTMNTDRATLTFSVTVNAGATLASSPASLAEDNLDGATLTVTLPSGFTYAAGVTAASFELVTSPTIAGLSISTVTGGTTGTTAATLTLAAGAGYGFDAASTLAVKVLAAAHSGSGDLTTGTLPVAPSAPPGVTVSRTSACRSTRIRARPTPTKGRTRWF